jgi:hypothetical protein
MTPKRLKKSSKISNLSRFGLIAMTILKGYLRN